jgi:hypothetical protein
MNLVGTGILRLNSSRVVLLKNIQDGEAFNQLMNNMPDFSYTNDGACLLVELKSDYLKYNKILESHPNFLNSKKSSNTFFLFLSSVRTFYPATERGQRLLNADSIRLNTTLGPPIFEKLWTIWLRTEHEKRNHLKGINFVEILDLYPFTFNYLSPDTREILTNSMDNLLIDHNDSNISIIKKSFLTSANILTRLMIVHKINIFSDNFFYSASNLSIPIRDTINNDTDFMNINIIEHEKKILNDFLHSDPAFLTFLETFDSNLSLFAHFDIVSFFSNFDALMRKFIPNCVSIFFIFPVIYYILLINSDVEISFKSLFADLYILKFLIGQNACSEATYYIGRHLQDTQILTLSASRWPSSFPLKSKALPFSLLLDDYQPKDWTKEDIKISID